jgi:hypothetical protein
MQNVSKPVSVFANKLRASGAELWSTIETTWLSETRTWDETVSLMQNATFLGLALWSQKNLPWQHAAPWNFPDAGMNNQAKP